MDAALKARSLGSAASRKQRIQERQVENHITHQQQVERKEQIMSDVQSIHDSDADADSETSSILYVDTSSESSIQTPENMSSPEVFTSFSPTIYDQSTEVSFEHGMKSVDQKSEGVPRMQATLTTIADWNYDRYSMLMDPADAEKIAAMIEEQEVDSSSNDDELEEYSPVEIATPIAYTMPKVRPIIVRIAFVRHYTNPLDILEKQSTARGHVADQTMEENTIETRRFFHASDSSRDTLGTSSSSQFSRSMSVTSQNDSMVSRSVSQTSQSDQSTKSPKRKSSMPLLFGNNKNRNSRLGTIKNFIRSSTLGPPASNQPSYHRSTSSSLLETYFEDRGGSVELRRENNVEQFARPRTARAPSSTFSMTDHFPVLPTAPPPAPPPKTTQAVSQAVSTVGEESKTKSASRFRSRSGSIGQALKSINAGPKRTDASAPPLPTLSIPPIPRSVDMNGVHIPPPLTPRNPRRSTATYSPFPTTERTSPTTEKHGLAVLDKRDLPSNVGLGLYH